MSNVVKGLDSALLVPFFLLLPACIGHHEVVPFSDLNFATLARMQATKQGMEDMAQGITMVGRETVEGNAPTPWLFF